MDPVATARRLRRQSTDAEKLLWRHLRNRQLGRVKFRRQMPINGFIADFCCTEARLIVEADGGQHGSDTDARRTAQLQAAGYRIIRFWNHDVLSNIDGVLMLIAQALAPPPHPDPLPAGEREI